MARIFLLLAMDATVMGDALRSPSARNAFVFMGQFCSAASFVTTLIGSDPTVLGSSGDGVTPDMEKRCLEWLDNWATWKMGFSHFVELPKTWTEDTLWYLLDRRAAGIFSRGQRGPDLVIPMFDDTNDPAELSFFLVQVKNRVDRDDRFPESALQRLSPAYVFGEKHTLQRVQPYDMIRLYMSLREKETDSKPARSVLVDKLDNEDEEYSLCVRGMFKPGDPSLSPWTFMSPNLTRQLVDIANAAFWDGMAQIQMDLDNRDKETKAGHLSRVMARADVVEGASHTLNI